MVLSGEVFTKASRLSFLRAEGGRRRGYMGHLTRIANSIVHNSDKGPNGAQIQQLISGLFKRIYIFLHCFKSRSTYICSLSELPEEDGERWEAFMSGQLSDINKKNTVDLVSVLLFSFWFSLLKLMLLFDNAHKSVLNIKTFFFFPPPQTFTG